MTTRFDQYSMMSATELRARCGIDVSERGCPFCGSRALALWVRSRSPHVVCLSCDAEGPRADPKTSSDDPVVRAARMWCSRAEDAPDERRERDERGRR